MEATEERDTKKSLGKCQTLVSGLILNSMTLYGGWIVQSNQMLQIISVDWLVGLKHFGKSGTDAVINELRQLDYRDVIKPVPARSLTRDQKCAALNYLMYMKQKQCGRIKAWGCADGRKQRLYKTKDETSSLTMSTEAVFLTAIINAQE